MIIRSQDNKKIVNFDVCHLSITADNCIVATNGVVSYPSEMLSGVIGEYSTEEKAIKVLDMRCNMKELKPCPFCGGEARILCPRGRLAWIRCDICRIETNVFETKKRAIEFWNRRAEQ